jgi:hypothetical protein
MEADGYWQLESDDGLELGGLGVSARLRDFGRFGQLMLEDGEAFGGRRVLPPGWRDLAGQPDSAPIGFGRLMPGSPASTTVPSRREAPLASSSSSIRPSRWSLQSRGACHAVRSCPRLDFCNQDRREASIQRHAAEPWRIFSSLFLRMQLGMKSRMATPLLRANSRMNQAGSNTGQYGSHRSERLQPTHPRR